MTDIRLQYRSGFYFVGGFMALVWLAVLNSLPAYLDVILPAFLLLNLLITTFYFMAALVLLEKDQGVLMGLAVTPIRGWHYFRGKIASLTLVAALENLLIVVLVYGFDVNWLYLLAGIVAGCVIYVLLGFVAVARYSSINDFLFPSMLMVTLLILPAATSFGDFALLYLHPLMPAMQLFISAFEPVAGWQLIYGVLGSILWGSLCFYGANHIFERYLR
jgi:fluoroquinolone transport system permease protein